jgi:hypothetical protein
MSCSDTFGASTSTDEQRLSMHVLKPTIMMLLTSRNSMGKAVVFFSSYLSQRLPSLECIMEGPPPHATLAAPGLEAPQVRSVLKYWSPVQSTFLKYLASSILARMHACAELMHPLSDGRHAGH